MELRQDDLEPSRQRVPVQARSFCGVMQFRVFLSRFDSWRIDE
jgi:hypothetical protein